MAYVYRGVEVEGIDHGTNTGYHQHRRKGVPACDACRIAHNTSQRERRPATRTNNWPALCGTDGGYTKHRRLGEAPCIACKVAHSEAELARYRKRREGVERKNAPADTRHGTPGGYRKHIRMKTTPCDPCRAAHAKDYAERKRKKKAAA